VPAELSALHGRKKHAPVRKVARQPAGSYAPWGRTNPAKRSVKRCWGSSGWDSGMRATYSATRICLPSQVR